MRKIFILLLILICVCSGCVARKKGGVRINGNDLVPSPCADIEVLGDSSLKPLMVFDDGNWTYFKMNEQGNFDGKKVPAIYEIQDNFETPANVRVVGSTLIAESVGTSWSLRSGDKFFCVRKKSFVLNQENK